MLVYTEDKCLTDTASDLAEPVTHQTPYAVIENTEAATPQQQGKENSKSLL